MGVGGNVPGPSLKLTRKEDSISFHVLIALFFLKLEKKNLVNTVAVVKEWLLKKIVFNGEKVVFALVFHFKYLYLLSVYL